MSARFFDFSDKDVLLPPIQQIEGMYFRVNPITEFAADSNKKVSGRATADETEDIVADFSAEELDVLYKRVAKNGRDGTFRLLLDKESIPNVLYPLLIGRNGQSKKNIEESTKCRIIIPERKDQARDKPIELIGYDDVQLVLCWRKMMASALSARMKQPFTHFLCFPVSSDEVLQNFATFRLNVLAKCGGARGFSDHLFQNPRKLHLTIGTLALFQKSEYDMAVSDLEECFTTSLWRLLNGKSFVCRLKGLEIMNDDPSEVDVLYGILDDPSGTVQKMANKIYKHFTQSSPRFLQDQFDFVESVKLHATLMNSRFRKGEEIGDEEQNIPCDRKTFDARQILKEFGNFDFGQFEIKEIHISQRYSTDTTGFYKATRKLELNRLNYEEQNAAEATEYLTENYGDEPECG